MTPETKAFIEEVKLRLHQCMEDAIDLHKGKVSPMNIRDNYESVMWLVEAQEKALQIIDEQWKEIEDLKSALKHGNCYCEVGIGNPMYRDHTTICKKLMESK